jgi:pyridoxine/pyridoxamine 5'-phosphate oxidase
MQNVIWEELISEMQLVIRQRTHPFRYPTLATLGLESMPRLRTVVLRHINSDPLRLTFYTDSRSKKIMHIKENNKVSLLCYDPDRMLQLRFDGIAELEKSEKILDHYKAELPEPTRVEYRSSQDPGSVISDPEQLEYLEEDDFFAAIHVYPFKVEYLKLNRPRHHRIRYSRKDSGWVGEYLVP